MIRDIVRAALAIAVMAVGAALLVETRYQLAAIDVAHRQATWQQQPVQQQAEPEPRIRRVGRAGLDLAEAAIGLLR